MSKWIGVLVIVAAFWAAGCGGDDTSPADASAACTPGQTALYEVCTANDDCGSCLCHSYGMVGQLCSKPCTSDNDCEPPSPGCNMMGVCKRPQ